jgi:hypothetical protein
MQKHLSRIFFTFFEELKNIENRVAWFLAELCKAEKSVQKDKANQGWTELVRGCLAPHLAYGIFLNKMNIHKIKGTQELQFFHKGELRMICTTNFFFILQQNQVGKLWRSWQHGK